MEFTVNNDNHLRDKKINKSMPKFGHKTVGSYAYNFISCQQPVTHVLEMESGQGRM